MAAVRCGCFERKGRKVVSALATAWNTPILDVVAAELEY